ncbi:MAG: tetratricopeptide repeat protein [Treponema sp.]|nr:tetratricopeptide repeat protein [Treponema sp.]
MKCFYKFTSLILFFLGIHFSFAQPWPFTGVPAEENTVLDKIRTFAEQGEKEKMFQELNYFNDHPESAYSRQLKNFQGGFNRTDPKIEMGISLFYEEEYEKAMKIAEEFLKENPGNIKALELHALARAYIEPKKSVEECDSVLYWIPFYPSFLSVKGTAYHNLGEKKEAIRIYTIYTKFKQDAEIYNRRGMSYQDLGMYEDAIGDYTESIRLDPTSGNKSYLNRAGVYYELGEYEKAKSDCAIFLKSGIAKNLTLTLLVFIYNAQDDYKKSLEYANRIIELYPNAVDGYYSRGWTYYNLGKYKKALKDCDKAIEMNSKFFESYWIRSYVYRKLGEFEKALTDANCAVEYAGDSFISKRTSYKARALCYLEANQKENALVDLERALEFSTAESERAEIQALIQKVKGL